MRPSTAGVLLALWSAPRSRSTAFFRMMLERGDLCAVHEPFSTLAEFGEVALPGRRVTSETGMIQALRELSEQGPVFFKDTTDERYPAVLADPDFLGTRVRSAFLIRHPAETIRSYHAINPQVKCHQIGMEQLYEVFTRVRSLTGSDPIVIDSADLIRSPPLVVRRYCDELGIPFLSHSLSWSAGDRPEWRATWRWHRDVSATTGFQSQPAGSRLQMPDLPHLMEYLEHHLPYYERLRQHRLRI